MKAIHDMGVLELATAIAQKQTSSVEAAQHLLARAKQFASLGAYLAFNEEDFQILPGGMEHLHRRLVAKEVIERLHRHLRPFDRIHQNRVAVFARQRHLDQAKLGPIGAFAQEFGVNRDIGLQFGGGAEGGEVFGRGDGTHGGLLPVDGARGYPAHPL